MVQVFENGAGRVVLDGIIGRDFAFGRKHHQFRLETLFTTKGSARTSPQVRMNRYQWPGLYTLQKALRREISGSRFALRSVMAELPNLE